MDMSDVDERSAHTASKSDLQAAIGKLKYHANSDKNKKGSADDKRHAKDLLAHYKKIQSSSDRADFVEKLKWYGIKGVPKMLEVVDSRMDVDDSLAVHVIKWMSPQQIFIAEGLLVSWGLRRNMGHISSGEDLPCDDIAGRLSQYGRHFL